MNLSTRKLKISELNRKDVAAFKQATKTPLTVILDDVRSLNNIGSVFRTSDAFLIEKIYLCGITAVPPHKDIQKTALGATESVDWEYAENAKELVSQLKNDAIQVWAVEQTENSQMLNAVRIDSTKKHAVIFGNEVKGVSQEVVDLCDGVIEIPQWGTKHSLNIAVSAGVVLWDFFKMLSAD
jgi:tRNA G18 (ribose-2'-O)-methylase SpoU